MSSETKEGVLMTLAAAVFVWVASVALFALFGLMDGAMPKNGGSLERCTNPPRRIEYVFPGHRIGCWLAEEVSE